MQTISRRQAADPFFQQTMAPWGSSLMDPFFDVGNLMDPSISALGTLGSAINPCNLVETSNAYKVEADVPGFAKDEIDISMIGNTLRLQGEHTDDQVEEGLNLRRERHRTRSFNRTFTLPMDVKVDEIKANLNAGVLHVEVPKLQTSEATQGVKRINIQ